MILKMEMPAYIGVLTVYPFGAFIIGTVFLWMGFKKKTKTALAAGLLWIIYGAYEYLMYARVLCSGECNIRLDLLVIYPFLFLFSIISALVFCRGLFHQDQ